VLALYNFDFELRHVLLKQILRVESHIKSRIAYRFSEQYGHDDYLKLANFDLGGGRAHLKRATEVMQSLQRDGTLPVK
jgi:abortive infection bacteriophage resistance protein